MAKSRLRSNRVKYKQSDAKRLGWSKTKTLVIVIVMVLLIAFILFVFIALSTMRKE